MDDFLSIIEIWGKIKMSGKQINRPKNPEAKLKKKLCRS